MASVAAVALWVNHQSISSNLYSGVPDGSDGNVYMVELLLENRFRSLLRYCAAQQLSAADLEWLLGSIAVEVAQERNHRTISDSPAVQRPGPSVLDTGSISGTSSGRDVWAAIRQIRTRRIAVVHCR